MRRNELRKAFKRCEDRYGRWFARMALYMATGAYSVGFVESFDFEIAVQYLSDFAFARAAIEEQDGAIPCLIVTE